MNLFTVFANPILESQFRRRMNKYADVEIGGWLFVTHWDDSHTPSETTFSRFRRAAIHPHNWAWLDVICGFMIVPNIEPKEQQPTTYSMKDIKFAQQIAEETALAHKCNAEHFHTHPNKRAWPSGQDLRFSEKYLRLTRNMATFSIVTTYPLRVWPFMYEFPVNGRSTLNERDKIERGEFVSWRTEKMRELLKNGVNE